MAKRKKKINEENTETTEQKTSDPLNDVTVEGGIDEREVSLLDQGIEEVETELELPSIDELQIELDRLRQESEEYLDGWQRARAEFANFKKRVEREQAEARARITADILSRYLDVIDDFERALREYPSNDESLAWVKGIYMIYEKLLLILEAEGVELIPAEGEVFDPNIHEAISYEDSEDHHDGQVIEVLKQGYLLGERVIRPALVRVAK
ncbi:MAG: nucleotide exchange factor GrpE [Anaerolineales bacterium]|nr:nucleotide exchange factor GrpE [Anaerolineales bacterium]